MRPREEGELPCTVREWRRLRVLGGDFPVGWLSCVRTPPPGSSPHDVSGSEGKECNDACGDIGGALLHVCTTRSIDSSLGEECFFFGLHDSLPQTPSLKKHSLEPSSREEAALPLALGGFAASLQSMKEVLRSLPPAKEQVLSTTAEPKKDANPPFEGMALNILCLRS